MVIVILKHLVNHVPVLNTRVQQITKRPAKHVVGTVQENRLQIQATQVVQVVQLMNISLFLVKNVQRVPLVEIQKQVLLQVHILMV